MPNNNEVCTLFTLFTLSKDPSVTQETLCYLPLLSKFEVRSYFMTDGQSVSRSVCLGVEPTLGLPARYYFLSEGCCLKVAVLFLWGALYDERTRLQFAVQSLIGPSRAGPITIPYCLIWSPEAPETEGPVSRIYIPQKQGGPIIPPGTGFSLRRLLRLAGLRWRYSNPPPTSRARSPYIYPSGTGWYSQKSKSRYDLRSINHYVLVPSPPKF
jgi:hypothetical protein